MKSLEASLLSHGWEPEQALQLACADLCRLVLHPSVIWHHSVNEGKRSKAAAGLAKAMGQRAGWPDFVFLWADRNVSGPRIAFVELKSVKGVISPAQEAFRGQAWEIGAEWALCRSLDEFHTILKAWGVPMKAAARVSA